MKTYANVGSRNAVTPQSEPIPGSTQKKNNAGGYSYALDDWGRLERFLILGSSGGTYYVKERELTRQNADVVERCIKVDGTRVVTVTAAISMSGRAPKNDPALFVLAMAASLGDDATRKIAFAHLPGIARTGTHLLHFVSFVEQFRGWGRSLRQGVAEWFNGKDAMSLAYQITKYPSRDKWSMRDVLRLAHVKPTDDAQARLLKYAAGKNDSPAFFDLPLKAGSYMMAVDQISGVADPKVASILIRDNNLPREVVPTELLKSPEVWEALLDDMPMTAMIRNLATMTRVGLIAPLSDGAKKVVDQLGDGERLRKARVHPIAILAALLTYKSGHGARGNNSWAPVSTVVDALNEAFYAAFGYIEPSNQRTLLALDVSGSMGMGEVSGIPGMTPRVASAVMAMVTARAEPQHAFMAFSHEFMPIDITAKQHLATVTRTLANVGFGGTDCALPMLWALKNKVPVDNFIVYTDSETRSGHIHPPQALRNYRRKMGIPAKLVVVGMTSAGFSICDPNDPGCVEVVGFDTAAPRVIADFARTELHNSAG